MTHKYERSHSEGETTPLHIGEGGDLVGNSESDSDDMSSIVESPVERDDIHPFSEDAEIESSPLLGNETVSCEEEPTVEELVRDEDKSPILWGARAWEDEERSATARKITKEDVSAQEILSDIADKKRTLPESLASLFSDPVTETHDNVVKPLDDVVEDTKGSADISKYKSAPPSPTSPFMEVCNDIDASTPDMQSSFIPSPSLGPSSGFSFTSSNPSDPSPMPQEGSVVAAVQQEAKPLKIDTTVMTENTDSIQSLQEVLQILRDRVAVVEKRIFELEALDTKKEYHAHGIMEQGSPLLENIKPNNVCSSNHPTTSAIKPASRLNTKTDVVGENIDRRKSPNNYASSDLNIYSYVFYASIGLAAMVLDRTIFGRGRA